MNGSPKPVTDRRSDRRGTRRLSWERGWSPSAARRDMVAGGTFAVPVSKRRLTHWGPPPVCTGARFIHARPLLARSDRQCFLVESVKTLCLRALVVKKSDRGLRGT
jgi:hypothetical protein